MRPKFSWRGHGCTGKSIVDRAGIFFSDDRSGHSFGAAKLAWCLHPSRAIFFGDPGQNEAQVR
jgi:hypothetical protein